MIPCRIVLISETASRGSGRFFKLLKRARNGGSSVAFKQGFPDFSRFLRDQYQPMLKIPAKNKRGKKEVDWRVN